LTRQTPSCSPKLVCTPRSCHIMQMKSLRGVGCLFLHESVQILASPVPHRLGNKRSDSVGPRFVCRMSAQKLWRRRAFLRARHPLPERNSTVWVAPCHSHKDQAQPVCPRLLEPTVREENPDLPTHAESPLEELLCGGGLRALSLRVCLQGSQRGSSECE